MNFHHKNVNIAICMEVAKSSNYDFKKKLKERATRGAEHCCKKIAL